MSITDDITQILVDEGGSRVTNNPADAGGRTQYGISERSNPQAWADGVVTEAEARAIYTAKYVTGPKFDQVIDPHLQAQLIDYGVTSGPAIAIARVQDIVHVTIDGVLGPATLYAINASDGRTTNNALVKARIVMIARLVQKTPTQVPFLTGWLTRAMEFYL